MPDYVASRITDGLNHRGRAVAGAAIVGVGMAYKRNIGDDRESPSLDVLRTLERRGAKVGVLDPHVPPDRLERHGFVTLRDVSQLDGWDMAVILTDHDDVDYAAIAERVEMVFDTRAVYRRLGLEADNVTLL